MKRTSPKDFQQQQATNERKRNKDLLRKVKAHNRMMQRDRMLSKESLKRMKELYAVRVASSEQEAIMRKLSEGII